MNAWAKESQEVLCAFQERILRSDYAVLRRIPLAMFSLARRRQMMRLIYIGALVLFISCLFSPAVSISKDAFKNIDCANPDEAPGWFFLVMGPLGILIGQFGWFANPLMLISALPLRRSLKSAFAILAAVLAPTSVALTYLPNDVAGNAVCGFESGFYLWLTCPVLLLLAALLGPVGRKDRMQHERSRKPTS
ncbi:hypothetical protein [Bradyrhizobium sp. ARR65]|uniref:hypothetical protein n=1 Tax=Bradyrhizobium sp. ARR65 TaxID=1040989 RepID=UPI000686C131|nr:hypothetical protein [Bradyrhizobium sp. ARR65]